jgi:hypothetical protein
MTGTEVQRIRQGLELTTRGLADLVGVHSSSVHRWELRGESEVKLERFPLQLLELARFALKQRGAKKFVKELRFAFVTGGGLFALYRLLDFALLKQPFYRRIVKSRYRAAAGIGLATKMIEDPGAPPSILTRYGYRSDRRS